MSHLCPRCDRKRRDCTCYGIFGDLPKREGVIPQREGVIPLPSEPCDCADVGRPVCWHGVENAPAGWLDARSKTFAEAPKPDELTVDDVLAYLARVIGTSESQRLFDLTETSPGRWFITDRGDYSAASGTLRGCLEWAKRRGLLG